MENFSRKLGTVENVFDVIHNVGGMIHTNIAKIEGLIQPQILQQALNLLQKRHPLLQVHIVNLENDSYFKSEGTKEIPLKIIKKNESNQWLKLAEEELQRKFIRNTNPLCRVTLLDGSETNNINKIITTFNHAISDGISYITFIHELLSYYQKIADGEKISDPVKTLFLPPLEEIVDRSLIDKDRIQNTQKKPTKKQQSPELLIEKEAELIDRRTRLLTRILNPEITHALIERCQQEQTTVHGALSAAMLFALSKHTFTNKPIKVSCGLSVNLRKYCLPEVQPEQIGCFVSHIEHSYILDENTNFWNLARECKSRIHQSISSGIPLNFLFNEQLKNINEDTIIQASKYKMGRKTTLDLSNIGRLNLDDRYGQLKLKELYFASGQHCIGPSLSLTVLTFQQQMFFTFSYVTPLLSEKTAHLLSNYVVDNIKTVCSSKSLQQFSHR